MKQPKLMRCPFCGGHARLMGISNTYIVRCDDCLISTAQCLHIFDAVIFWNSRFVNGVRLVYHWKTNGFKALFNAAAASSNGKAVKHG